MTTNSYVAGHYVDDFARHALAVLLSANPRSIQRDASNTDRLMVSRSALLRLREAFEDAYPGVLARGHFETEVTGRG